MSDFDLDRLGDVWRQQPDAAEIEALQRAAAAVSRRARISRIFDVLMAAAVVVAVIALALSNPRAEVIAFGSALVALLFYNSVRQRRLRQVELRSLIGTTEGMLDQSADRIEARIRYNRFLVVAFGPTLLVAFLFRMITRAPQGAFVDTALHALLERPLFFASIVAVLAGTVVYLLIRLRRDRRELERLRTMRDAYRREREFTRG